MLVRAYHPPGEEEISEYERRRPCARPASRRGCSFSFSTASLAVAPQEERSLENQQVRFMDLRNRTLRFFFLVAHSSAFAETKRTGDFPPVERASYHQLVFADDDFSVLSNLYRPGGDSGFHAHYRDMFYVVIQPMLGGSVQKLGEPLVAVPQAVMGTAAFGDLGGESRVHRVVNSDKSIAQFIVVELRRTKPKGKLVSSREVSKQYMQIVDNPRLRAWRLILEPGQSTASISQVGKGIRIVVRGGMLSTISPGIPDQVLVLRPGDFSVQPPSFTRALTNTGTETIELVEMELK